MTAQSFTAPLTFAGMHALAAADDLSCLSEYLQWVRKTKRSANLSRLIADAVPKTGGQKSTSRRKGGPRRSSSSKSDSVPVSRSSPPRAPTSSSHVAPATPVSQGGSSMALLNSPLTSQTHPVDPFARSLCSPSYHIHSPVYAQSVDMHSNYTFGPSQESSSSEEGPPAELFTLQWLTGARIRMYYGCSTPIRTDTSTVPSPPYDMIIRYKERRRYRDPKTFSERVTAKEENTYYHPLKQCVLQKHPEFMPWMLFIPADVMESLFYP